MNKGGELMVLPHFYYYNKIRQVISNNNITCRIINIHPEICQSVIFFRIITAPSSS